MPEFDEECLFGRSLDSLSKLCGLLSSYVLASPFSPSKACGEQLLLQHEVLGGFVHSATIEPLTWPSEFPPPTESSFM